MLGAVLSEAKDSMLWLFALPLRCVRGRRPKWSQWRQIADRQIENKVLLLFLTCSEELISTLLIFFSFSLFFYYYVRSR